MDIVFIDTQWIYLRGCLELQEERESLLGEKLITKKSLENWNVRMSNACMNGNIEEIGIGLIVRNVILV